jgi:hypothetical protein
LENLGAEFKSENFLKSRITTTVFKYSACSLEKIVNHSNLHILKLMICAPYGSDMQIYIRMKGRISNNKKTTILSKRNFIEHMTFNNRVRE